MMLFDTWCVEWEKVVEHRSVSQTVQHNSLMIFLGAIVHTGTLGGYKGLADGVHSAPLEWRKGKE